MIPQYPLCLQNYLIYTGSALCEAANRPGSVDGWVRLSIEEDFLMCNNA